VDSERRFFGGSDDRDDDDDAAFVGREKTTTVDIVRIRRLDVRSATFSLSPFASEGDVGLRTDHVERVVSGV
jgi:hypothetical protein